MRKLTGLVAAILLLALSLSACSKETGREAGGSDPLANEGSAQGEARETKPDGIAQAIMEQVTFQNALLAADENAVGNYYRLNDAVKDYAIYIDASGASAEEVAVLVGVSASDIQALRDIAELRLQAQIAAYEDYVPGELVKLADPVIVTRDNVLVMVLADDAQQAQAAVDELLR